MAEALNSFGHRAPRWLLQRFEYIYRVVENCMSTAIYEEAGWFSPERLSAQIVLSQVPASAPRERTAPTPRPASIARFAASASSHRAHR